MKINGEIVIEPNGKISIFTRTGTFAQGENKLKALLEALNANGISVTEGGKIEQHLHGPNGEHINISHHVHSRN